MTTTNGIQPPEEKFAPTKSLTPFVIPAGLGVVASVQHDYEKKTSEAFLTQEHQAIIAAQSIQPPGNLPAIRAFNISGRNDFKFRQDAAPANLDRIRLLRPFAGSSWRWISVT